jgi:hypothetical protein
MHQEVSSNARSMAIITLMLRPICIHFILYIQHSASKLNYLFLVFHKFFLWIESTDIFHFNKSLIINYSSHLTCSSTVTVGIHLWIYPWAEVPKHQQQHCGCSTHVTESYCCGGGACLGPQKTQLHAGPPMQFPLRAPRAMQLWLHSFGIQSSPNLITAGSQSPLPLLSVDAVVPTSSANLNKKFLAKLLY